MSTLIIRDLDEHLALELKREAKKRDLSVNRFLRQIIEAALRGAPAIENDRSDRLRPRNNSAQFAGGWTQADQDEFDANTAEFRQIEPDAWK